MKILITKYSNWDYSTFKYSEHPEYVAIRNIIKKNPDDSFILVGEGKKYGHFEKDGINFYNIGISTKIMYFFSFIVTFLLPLFLRPAVVISMGTINLVPYGVSSRFLKCKFIPVVTAEIGYSFRLVPPIFNLFYVYILKSVFNYSKTILVLSKSIKAEIINSYQVEPEKIKIYTLKISKIFNPNVTNDLKLILNPDGPIIMSICRISPDKGLYYLVEAARAVIIKYPNVKIIIKGYTSDFIYKKNLISLIQKSNLSKNVILLDGSPYSEIPRYISASDIFVLPSISEGLGLVVLEAMASGKPIVATRVGGLQDILFNNINGLMVEPKNSNGLAKAIIKILSDDQLRSNMSKGALSFIQRFNNNTLEDFLNKLLKNS